MTNKKLLQLAAIVVIGAVIFSTILLVGMRKIKRDTPPTDAPTLPPTQVSTTAPTTTEAVPAVTIDGNYVESQSNPTFPTSGTTAAPASTSAALTVPQEKADVIRTYVAAVNALKATPAFTLQKSQTLNVAIDEMTPSSMRALANKIIDGSQKAPETFNFSGGSDAASGKSATFVIAPAGKNAALDPAAVTNAAVTPTADGGCTLTLTLGADTQTLSAPPAKLAACMDVLSVESMGLPSAAKIDEMNVQYDNAAITATLDKDGRIVQMEHRLVVTDATANGSYVMGVTLRMHGDAVTQYKVTY